MQILQILQILYGRYTADIANSAELIKQIQNLHHRNHRFIYCTNHRYCKYRRINQNRDTAPQSQNHRYCKYLRYTAESTKLSKGREIQNLHHRNRRYCKYMGHIIFYQEGGERGGGCKFQVVNVEKYWSLLLNPWKIMWFPTTKILMMLWLGYMAGIFFRIKKF